MLLFFSCSKSSKLNFKRFKKKFPILSRMVIDENKTYSNLKKAFLSVLEGKKLSLGQVLEPQALFVQILMIVGRRLETLLHA